MDLGPRIVFVLGAGFTRAFLPQAPLLTDDYDGDALTEKFKNFHHASRILGLERSKNLNGYINVERLMTRLDGLMPYDFEEAANDELTLLLSEVKRCFRRRLEEAKKGPFHAEALAAFARYCVENGITCITFNYDDVFDKALWEVKKPLHGVSPPYWHPDGGYGFFCRPSEVCVRDADVFMDTTSMLLLKLHGSINWRVRRGYSQPYAVDALVHDEEWLPSLESAAPDCEAIANHLEPEPFIVPPVLVKATLIEQPILRLVWSLAYKALGAAERVTFVGYSLPGTDIAAGFLFGEALRKLPMSRLRIVNLGKEDADRKTLQEAYGRVFHEITEGQFEFRDALEWSCQLVEGH